MLKRSVGLFATLLFLNISILVLKEKNGEENKKSGMLVLQQSLRFLFYFFIRV